jgi:hypothetical protein
MLESTRWRIAILGNHGFSAKLIRKMCKKYDGEDFSPSTIYKALKLEASGCANTGMVSRGMRWLGSLRWVLASRGFPSDPRRSGAKRRRDGKRANSCE